MRRFLRSFGLGISPLGRGWNWSSQTEPVRRRSVDYYFARVGERLIRARRQFEDQYLGAAGGLKTK